MELDYSDIGNKQTKNNCFKKRDFCYDILNEQFNLAFLFKPLRLI